MTLPYPRHGSVFVAGRRIVYETRADSVELATGDEITLWQAKRYFPGSTWAIAPQSVDGECWMGVLATRIGIRQ